jgi:CBS domain-containing protein
MKVASDFLVEVPLLKYDDMVTRARQILREDVFREIYVHDGRRKLVGYIDISDVLTITATKSNVTIEGFAKPIRSVKDTDPIDVIITSIKQNETSSIPVVDDSDLLIGGVLLSELFPVLLTRRKIHGKVREYMSERVVTCTSDEPVSKIHTLIIDSGFYAFPVLKKKKIVGIVSRRDLLKDGRWRTSADGASTTPLENIMTTPVLTVSPDEDIQVAADLMVRHDVSRLPVVKGDRIIGIIDRHDVLDAMS